MQKEDLPKLKMLPFKMPRQGGKAYPTAQLFYDAIMAYFEFEEGRGVPPMVTGLQEFLEISDQTWLDYANGKNDTPTDNYKEIAEIARKHIVTAKAQGAYIGLYNPTFAKFDLSANHNWVEKKAVDLNTSGSSKIEVKQEPLDPAEALRVYQEAIKRAVLDEDKKDENQ